jgi:transposase InsO family protein
MDLHKNARSCPRSRELMVARVLGGEPPRTVAEALGVSERTVYKWLKRYREEGVAGLRDRRSSPRRIPHRLGKSEQERILALREQRLSQIEIAWKTGIPRSTVSRWLRRWGKGRLPQLAPPEPIRRYEKAHAGELVHLDIKKLGKIRGVGHRITGQRQHRNRGIGWEFAHVAIDDASRVAYVEILDNERAVTAQAFLRRARAWFADRGVTIQRILTDNGSCYVANTFASLCRELGMKHSRTRPYRPRTNGKAERFIQTLLREWAYAFAFNSSKQRTQLLSKYLHFYNLHRAHAALSGKPPYSRLPLNNVLGFDI